MHGGADIKTRIMSFLQKVLPTRAHYLRKELSSCRTVLDLGCGSSSPLQYCNVRYSLGVDTHIPYLVASKQRAIHSEYVAGDITKIEFTPKSFDAVIAFAVLEHLSKKDGWSLLRKAERWARIKVIVDTPNGYLEQTAYNNNPLQEHRSGWTPSELRQRGFDVYGCQGLKVLRGMGGIPKLKPRLLWEAILYLTQPIIYHFPNLAFGIFAVKQVDEIEEQEPPFTEMRDARGDLR